MQIDLETLTYNADGLIPAIAQDHRSKDILMMAWMNKTAIELTLNTKRVTYWSRSRQSMWTKGETSGNTQTLIDFRIDCDRDCIMMLVEQIGPACHTGAPNCFFTHLHQEGDAVIAHDKSQA